MQVTCLSAMPLLCCRRSAVPPFGLLPGSWHCKIMSPNNDAISSPKMWQCRIYIFNTFVPLWCGRSVKAIFFPPFSKGAVLREVHGRSKDRRLKFILALVGAKSSKNCETCNCWVAENVVVGFSWASVASLPLREWRAWPKSVQISRSFTQTQHS